MPSELQTNVCVMNHLSDTREEGEREQTEEYERGGVGMKRHREETLRDRWWWWWQWLGGGGGGVVHGQLTLYSWSLTSHEIGLEYQTQIPPPSSSTPSTSSRVLSSTPSLLSSSPQNRFPRQHHRGSEVRCGVGWGGWVSERGSIWKSDPT